MSRRHSCPHVGCSHGRRLASFREVAGDERTDTFIAGMKAQAKSAARRRRWI